MTTVVYHDNGVKREEYIIKNGYLDGLSQTWYKSGNLKSECTYVNSNLHGLYRQWYDTDKSDLYCEYSYNNGKKCGVCKYWHEDGKLMTY